MLRVKNKVLIIIGIIIILGVCGWGAYALWFRPASLLVVNALPAQAADIVLNNDCRRIKIECKSMEEAKDFDKYDAILTLCEV